MTKTKKRIYWDACAFIHHFQQTEQYADALDHIEGQAKADEATIVTCAVTIAEVCKLPETGLLPIEQTRKILRFLENDYVEMWQADRLVCEESHHIIRLHGLKPMDAIHVAAALMAKVDVLITTDTKKYRRGGLLGLDGRVGNPPLKIKPPVMGSVLPLWSTDEAEGDQDAK